MFKSYTTIRKQNLMFASNDKTEKMDKIGEILNATIVRWIISEIQKEVLETGFLNTTINV